MSTGGEEEGERELKWRAVEETSKQHQLQKYRKECERDPNFAGWLRMPTKVPVGH